jgi:basic membrane protein A
MKKLLTACAVLMLAAGLHAAPVKIALIVESTVNDKGWGQAFHDAIVAVQKKYGSAQIEYSYSEKMKPVDAGAAARQYVSKGYEIIIAHGAQFKNLILEMAPEFPTVTFAFGTSAEKSLANVFTYMPQSEETGYVNGIVAGLVTKTNIVGIVGPVDGGDAASYNRGFYLGVKASNPKADIKIAYTGSFGDYVKAGELAKTQLAAGADVLSGSAQQAVGALKAVAELKDKPVWWFAQDTAQLTLPESFKILSGSSYEYAAVVESILAKRKAGILGGESIPLNFKNGGFSFVFNDKVGPVLTPAAKAAGLKALDAFKAGTLVLDWKAVKF